jgi:hypothetical protein
MPKSKKASQPSESSKVPKSGVTIRMYNPGFGDCFLLTFHTPDGSPRYMLIDCGVHHRYPDSQKRMKLIADNIAKVTGKHLHIVAVTHEHTDHLYGFRYAKDIFDKIDIDDLWLAWTENPADPVAKQLKGDIKEGVKQLTSAVNRLGTMDRQAATALQGILDFELAYGELGAKTSELEYLRNKSTKKLLKSADYRRPGEDPLTIPGVSGVKVYVLGPPRNVADIKTVDRESEMYPEFTALNESQAFAAALKGSPANVSAEDELIVRRSCPFDKRYDLTFRKAKTNPDYKDFFRINYGFTGNPHHGPEWRRIDDDWLGPASDLALKINNMTNNTSLVLAFELTESQPHKVLLFVGDAQVGNWLSWQKVEWGTGTEKIKGEDLLRRTVLIKVGHHGSRNATLRQKGLEMMDDSKLVAMIPVDQKWANDEMHWEHPAEKLLRRLEEKTKNRLLRTDKISSMPETLKKPETLQESEWQVFLNSVEWDHSPDNLWIQYTMEGQL